MDESDSGNNLVTKETIETNIHIQDWYRSEQSEIKQ